MSSESKTIQKPDDYDFAKLERIITDEHFDVNELRPAINQLSAKYLKLEQQFSQLANENNYLQMQLSEITRSLDHSSRIDPMTGLANRRDIMEKIKREQSRTTRHHGTFSIIMVDVDNFQHINDTYGLNTGDDVLVEVARVLMSSVRNEDICARWGGEEFLLLLPETSINGAVAVTGKILESVYMTDFCTQKPGIHITVSLGVCEHIPGQTIFECVSRADQALKAAKSAGKNQFSIAP